MRRIVIFSGTGEGRALSRALAAEGAAVTVCVATDYGREEQGETPGVTVHTGRLDADEMAALVRGAALCVDATHPYAAAASRNVSAACAAAGVRRVRLLRPAGDVPPDCVRVPGAEAAAAYLRGTTGNVFLTTGAKELPAFAALGPARLFARVLPSAEGLAACAAAGVPRANVVAMQGPFGFELNLALLRQFDIRYLVTKDGGAAGGFAEKMAAAKAAGAVPVLIDRPPDAGESYDAVLKICREVLQCR